VQKKKNRGDKIQDKKTKSQLGGALQQITKFGRSKKQRQNGNATLRH